MTNSSGDDDNWYISLSSPMLPSECTPVQLYTTVTTCLENDIQTVIRQQCHLDDKI